MSFLVPELDRHIFDPSPTTFFFVAVGIPLIHRCLLIVRLREIEEGNQQTSFSSITWNSRFTSFICAHMLLLVLYTKPLLNVWLTCRTSLYDILKN
jgi:hypothetical protein